MAENNPSTLTRRSFLKATALTAGAAAVVGTAGCTSIAEQPEEVAEQMVEEQVFYNKCGGNCGGPFCRMKGIVREGKLVQVVPVTDYSPEHPTFKSGCVKGQTNPQRLYGTKRVLYPLKRVDGTERGAGEWERISWDEAITLLADHMKAAQEQYGDSSVAFQHSFVGNGVLDHATSFSPIKPRKGTSISLERFLKKTGATVMPPSADMSFMWMMGQVDLPFGSMNEVSDAKTVVLWGLNPIGATRNAWHFLRKAKESGTKIVTIDPRFQLNAAQSDIYVPIRPGTDGYMMLAMCNYIVDNDLVDWDYVRNNSVSPHLIKEDGTYLRLSDLGLPPEEGPADPQTGEPTTIDAIAVYDENAQTFGSANAVQDPAVLGTFEANGMKVRPVLDYVLEHIKEYTIEKAAEVCDVPAEKIVAVADLYATNKPAGLATYQGLGHYSNSRHNFKNMVLLACLTGNLEKKGTFLVLNHLMETDESGVPAGGNTDTTKLLEVEGAKENVVMAGMALPGVLETGKLGDRDLPIKVVYNFQGNPLASDSGRQEMIEGYKKLDFFCVADPYMSDTARYADLVLPIALNWEKEDSEGSYALFEKAVEPAGECKSDMDVFRMLAEKMGFPELYDKTDEEYLRAALDTPFNRANGFTYDDYKEHRFIARFPDEVVPDPMPAPVGKKRMNYYIEKPETKDDNGAQLDWDVERRPYWTDLDEGSVNNPAFEKYPLIAFSIHEIYHSQTVFVDVPWLDELRPEPHIEISEEAAAARGIKQGDTVRVFNDRGFAVVKAVVTKGIRSDCILYPNGWQTDDFIAGHIKDLTALDLCPYTGNSAYNGFLCEVELYEGGAE